MRTNLAKGTAFLLLPLFLFLFIPIFFSPAFPPLLLHSPFLHCLLFTFFSSSSSSSSSPLLLLLFYLFFSLLKPFPLLFIGSSSPFSSSSSPSSLLQPSPLSLLHNLLFLFFNPERSLITSRNWIGKSDHTDRWKNRPLSQFQSNPYSGWRHHQVVTQRPGILRLHMHPIEIQATEQTVKKTEALINATSRNRRH